MSNPYTFALQRNRTHILMSDAKDTLVLSSGADVSTPIQVDGLGLLANVSLEIHV